MRLSASECRKMREGERRCEEELTLFATMRPKPVMTCAWCTSVEAKKRARQPCETVSGFSAFGTGFRGLGVFRGVEIWGFRGLGG